MTTTIKAACRCGSSIEVATESVLPDAAMVTAFNDAHAGCRELVHADGSALVDESDNLRERVRRDQLRIANLTAERDSLRIVADEAVRKETAMAAERDAAREGWRKLHDLVLAWWRVALPVDVGSLACILDGNTPPPAEGGGK